jgi:hypothetical protein
VVIADMKISESMWMLIGTSSFRSPLEVLTHPFQSKQLTLVKSLKEAQFTCMIADLILLKWAVDVECLIFICHHSMEQIIIIYSLLLCMVCLDSTKKADISGFSLYIARVDLRNDRRQNQMDKSLLKICSALINL